MFVSWPGKKRTSTCGSTRTCRFTTWCCARFCRRLFFECVLAPSFGIVLLLRERRKEGWRRKQEAARVTNGSTSVGRDTCRGCVDASSRLGRVVVSDDSRDGMDAFGRVSCIRRVVSSEHLRWKRAGVEDEPSEVGMSRSIIIITLVSYIPRLAWWLHVDRLSSPSFPIQPWDGNGEKQSQAGVVQMQT